MNARPPSHRLAHLRSRVCACPRIRSSPPALSPAQPDPVRRRLADGPRLQLHSRPGGANNCERDPDTG